MKKPYFTVILLLLLIPHLSHAQYIKWSADAPLTWSDFSGNVDESNPYDGHTHAVINYHYTVRRSGALYTLTFNITGGFDKAGSWIKNGHETAKLLKHEQLHFDISELFARRLYIAFNQKIYTANYAQEVKDIFADTMAQCRAMQEQYDNESNHSRVIARQQEWEETISQQLKQTPVYPDL